MKSTMTINHVGIAVRSITDFLERNRVLYSGFSHGPVITNITQGVNEMFITDGKTVLELLEPLNESSPIAAVLKSSREGKLVHLALDVDDLENSLREIEEAGGRTIVDPVPDVAFGQRRIAFVFLNGHVTELIERPRAVAGNEAQSV
jgi:methylmalonyl-CoA epimerase